MNKNQPFLTGFPTRICGKVARRLQAVIARRRDALRDSSIATYALQFSHILSPSFLDAISTTQKQGPYSNVNVFWAWLAQALEANASLCKAVSLIQTWCEDAGLPAPTDDTGTYSNGRKRLSLDFLEKVRTRISEHLTAGVDAQNLYKGHCVKSIDGSSLELDDTKANQEAYPQHTTQTPGCGFPIMGIMGVLNHGHGGWEDFVEGQQTAHDAPVFHKLLHCFEEGDIMCADRAFCTYEIRSVLKQKGVYSLIRLHQARHRTLDWRKGRRVSKHERIVEWVKPPKQSASSQLSAEEWAALPERMEVRLIRFYYEDRDGNKRRMVLGTTLLDGEKYEWQELAAIYVQRWDIELRLRDLKTTMQMERLRVKTPEMAQKSLAMCLIAFNLIKATSQQAAREAGIDHRLISFKATLDTITSYSNRFMRHQKHGKKIKQIWSQMVALVSEKIINVRPFRTEPRAQKKRPKSYSYLTKPRSEYKEAPHRGKLRSLA